MERWEEGRESDESVRMNREEERRLKKRMEATKRTQITDLLLQHVRGRQKVTVTQRSKSKVHTHTNTTTIDNVNKQVLLQVNEKKYNVSLHVHKRQCSKNLP